MTQETQTGALYQPRRVGWGGEWKGGSKRRRYMYVCMYMYIYIHTRMADSC